MFSLRVRGTRIADIAFDTPQIWGSPQVDDDRNGRRAGLEFVCVFGHDEHQKSLPKFVEFFIAHIRNKNTCSAYTRDRDTIPRLVRENQLGLSNCTRPWWQPTSSGACAIRC